MLVVILTFPTFLIQYLLPNLSDVSGKTTLGKFGDWFPRSLPTDIRRNRRQWRKIVFLHTWKGSQAFPSMNFSISRISKEQRGRSRERSTPSKKKDYLRENRESQWNVLTVIAWNTHDTEKQDRVSSVTDARSAEGYMSFRMARICTPRSWQPPNFSILPT